MITYSKIIQDLEEIYQLLLKDQNLTLAIKAKELQGRQLEMIEKNCKQNQPLKDMKIDNLIKLAQKYAAKTT